MTYEDEHTKVLLLGGKSCGRKAVQGTCGGQFFLRHLKLGRAVDEPKHDVRTTFLELLLYC
jgi:hypothetical protein